MEQYLRRLAFAKYLIRQGHYAISGGRFEVPSSILHFHDALEIFLYQVAEACGVNTKKRINFLDYWDRVKEVAKVTLPDRRVMKELNDARNDLKHHARFPSKDDCLYYHKVTIDFIEMTLSLVNSVLPVAWDEISSYSLITNKYIRDHLSLAEEAKRKENFEQAFAECATANAYFEKHYLRPWIKQYFPEIHFRHLDAISSRDHDGDDWANWGRLSDFNEELKETFETLQGHVVIFSLGVDLRAWTRFQKLVPIAHVSSNDENVEVIWRGHGDIEQNQTHENAQFCIDFVLDCSLQIQEVSPNIRTHYDEYIAQQKSTDD